MLADFDGARAEQFKQSTKDKLRGLRCPDHHQPPRLHFQGALLREITISMSGCCEKLMELANARIASAPATAGGLRKPA
jgi:5'-3' exonuclease